MPGQRKSNRKLPLVFDLRKINNLISDDYIKNNHPVSTLADAVQQKAGRKLFCEMDCSQAYHCLQMAEQRPLDLLDFNILTFPVEHLHIADWPKATADLFRPFPAFFENIFIQSSKRISARNVLITATLPLITLSNYFAT